MHEHLLKQTYVVNEVVTTLPMWLMDLVNGVDDQAWPVPSGQRLQTAKIWGLQHELWGRMAPTNSVSGAWDDDDYILICGTVVAAGAPARR